MWRWPRAVFAREGPHRGSVHRRSAASSQALFLLERSLTYHCAWHLRLTESWMPFHLREVGSALTFLSESCAWLLAVTSELRSSPHSVCVVTRAPSTELLFSPLAARGWDAVVWESVCLLSCARHWCRNPAGTTHVVRPCFEGLQADVCMSFPRACSVAVFCRRGHLVCKANLLSAVSRCNVLRLLQPSLHMLTRCLVVSGHHSTNPALFADRPVSGIGGVLPAES